MEPFSKIIHYNRDENSYTARLFEGILFPMWRSDPSSFGKCMAKLAEGTWENFTTLTQKNPTWVGSLSIDDDLQFIDGMLFLENLDLFGYCHREKVKVDLEGDRLDKTEFDCVVVAEGRKSGKQVAIVFEVKCFTDLKPSEIRQQRRWLNRYKRAGIFHAYHHISLISQENLERARVFFKDPVFELGSNATSIVTWRQVYELVQMNGRFDPNIEFNKLKKHITTKGKTKGEAETPRTLVGSDFWAR